MLFKRPSSELKALRAGGAANAVPDRAFPMVYVGEMVVQEVPWLAREHPTAGGIGSTPLDLLLRMNLLVVLTAHSQDHGELLAIARLSDEFDHYSGEKLVRFRGDMHLDGKRPQMLRSDSRGDSMRVDDIKGVGSAQSVVNVRTHVAYSATYEGQICAGGIASASGNMLLNRRRPIEPRPPGVWRIE